MGEVGVMESWGEGKTESRFCPRAGDGSGVHHLASVVSTPSTMLRADFL